jgi:hypothetical protein
VPNWGLAVAPLNIQVLIDHERLLTAGLVGGVWQACGMVLLLLSLYLLLVEPSEDFSVGTSAQYRSSLCIGDRLDQSFWGESHALFFVPLPFTITPRACDWDSRSHEVAQIIDTVMIVTVLFLRLSRDVSKLFDYCFKF